MFPTARVRNSRGWTLTSVRAPRLIALRVALDAQAKLVVGLAPIAVGPQNLAAVAVRLADPIVGLLGVRKQVARRGGDAAEQEQSAPESSGRRHGGGSRQRRADAPRARLSCGGARVQGSGSAPPV